MANFTITWPAPGPSNSTGQIIEYRDVSAGGSWQGTINVSSIVGSYTFVGLHDNTVYEFRVTNECIYGGTELSNTLSSAFLNCPSFTVNPNYTFVDGYTIDFNWTSNGPATYIELDVTLLDSTGTITIDSTTLSDPTYSYTFTGLSASTTYIIHVDVKIDLSGVGSGPYLVKSDCPDKTAQTADELVCELPTLISVSSI